LIEATGWLLDLYEDPQGGVALWLLSEDGARLRLRQDFPVSFAAAGAPERLRALWRFLQEQPVPVQLSRTERRDLFQPGLCTVLEAQLESPSALPRLFRQVSQVFPELTFYDADPPLALRHAARLGTFPLARCRIQAGDDGRLQHLDVLDTPWDLSPMPAPLRVLELEPDCDPAHGTPRCLLVRSERMDCRLPLDAARPLLINLRGLLEQYDPDLLLTRWGDTWLMPRLLEMARETNLPLPLNREPHREVARRAQRSYFSYGQIIFRGQQITLFGRWHIDRMNATLWSDYGLEGVLEAARVTALPVQTSARTSPGTGISAMQMITAMRGGILVPWHKQQAERPKSALDLLHSDLGGLVYQPLTGLHALVGEIDFISMYPSIMVHGNISPETTPHDPREPTDEPPGLIPQTLGPLLEKRVALKRRLASLPAWHPERSSAKARSSAHKWLLVTCFGYLGYKNARFGRIESHEAVTAGGREALMRAKETAEDQGFTVLHMFVDCLWVQRPNTSRAEDYQDLLAEIEERSGLPIALDGIYRWVAFLPSRVNERVPVPNRYFGVFQDGTIKMRGIEARRRDTPTYIAEAQMELIEWFAKAPDAESLPRYIPGALELLRRQLAELRAGRVPAEKLLLAQRLSRKLEAYTSPSPAAQAAQQLAAIGKILEPGQRVRFVLLRGGQRVQAWDLPQPPNPAALDAPRYCELLLRAAETIFSPMGVPPDTLRAWAINQPTARPLPFTRSLSGRQWIAAG